HGIGVALHHMGQPADAIPHVWRGFELYEDEESGLRALNDIGIMLLTVGDTAGADRALSEVVRRGGTQESTSNAMIELMHCASFRRDRGGGAGVRHRGAARGLGLVSAARRLTRLPTGVAVLCVAWLRIRPGAGGVGAGAGSERERHDD